MSESRNLDYQAAGDMAKRSRSGALAYPAILSIIALFTPFSTDHTVIFTIISIIILLCTIGRSVCAWWFDIIYNRNIVLWKVVNNISVLGLAFSWGILSMSSVFFYQWEWVTMVTCLSAAAFSAGAVTAFSINYRLTIIYLVLMFAPTLAVTALINTQQSMIATFLFGVYFVFLINTTKKLHNEYWKALKNLNLLNERATELETKNKELESFSYSVSHDLRSPLRSIGGFSAILKDECADRLDETELSYLRSIQNSAHRMDEIIEDLLRLSRISRVEFNPQPVNLSSLVEANIKKICQQEPKRKFDVQIEPDLNTIADFSLMDVAINNLVSNACKYSSRNDCSKIRFARTVINGEETYFIEDNGVGFDNRFYNKLFNPFQRLHTNDDFPGTGIGLATVKRIVMRHGGKVWANARINAGATFYFTLPSSHSPKNLSSA